MSDFMDGDQFPDRPDHPDFWRLSEIFLQLDGSLEDGTEDVVERAVAASGVDIDSISYMLSQRANAGLNEILPGLPENLYVLILAYACGASLEAFLAGIKFEQRRKNE